MGDVSPNVEQAADRTALDEAATTAPPPAGPDTRRERERREQRDGRADMRSAYLPSSP